MTRENADEYFLVRTPEEIPTQIQDRIDVGVTKLMGWFVDSPDIEGMELFADEVVPQFR